MCINFHSNFYFSRLINPNLNFFGIYFGFKLIYNTYGTKQFCFKPLTFNKRMCLKTDTYVDEKNNNGTDWKVF